VAHVGQELGFGAGGGLGGVAGGFEFAIGLGELVLEQLVAQDGFNAGADFGEVAGFGDVIDGAEFEAADFVVGAVPGGEDDDGDGVEEGVLLDLLENVKTIIGGESEVEEDQLDGAGMRRFRADSPSLAQTSSSSSWATGCARSGTSPGRHRSAGFDLEMFIRSAGAGNA
jgi:hypothetical protein